MPLKFTYDNPSYPKGQEMDVYGIGLIPNGSSVELTEEQERRYVSLYGMSVKDANKDDGNVKVEGTSHLQTRDVREITGLEISDTFAGTGVPDPPVTDATPITPEGGDN